MVVRMIPAVVEVQVNQEYIDQRVDAKIDEFVRPQMILCSLDRLCKMYDMSMNTFKDNFLHDPRVLMHERTKSTKGKRRFLYEPTIAAIKQIMDEW